MRKSEAPTTSPKGSSGAVCDIAFVVGMSRSGTTWMEKCLNTHSGIAAFFESTYWGRKYIRPSENGNYSLGQVRHILGSLKSDPGINHILAGGTGCLKNIDRDVWRDMLDHVEKDIERPISPGDLFRLVCREIAELEGANLVVEKTPHHVHHVDRIKKEIPCARFVVMQRDPYGFLLSHKYRANLNKGDSQRRTRGMFHPFLVAWIWRGHARSNLRLRVSHPDSVLIVEYDDIRLRPQAVLERVQSFLGVQIEEIMLPPTYSSFPSGHRPELEPQDTFWLNFLCGSMIEKMGYPQKATPFAPFRVLGSLMRIPLCLVRTGMALKRSNTENVAAYLLRKLFLR